MSNSNAVSIEAGEGRCALSGALGFATVTGLWRELQSGGLLGRSGVVDLSRIVSSDSAGLALLVAWRAACAGAGGRLHFEAVPERLQALARLTGAEALLAS